MRFSLLLLLCSASSALDLGKVLGGGGMMGASAAVVPPVVHHDASTGTVTELTEAQAKSARAAMTCDSVMVKSLVLANEDKMQAEKDRDYFQDKFQKATDRVNELTSALETTKRDLEAEIANLEALLDLTKVEAEINIQRTKDEAEKRVEDHAKSKAKQIGELEKAIEDVKADATENMVQAKAKWVSQKEGLEREMQQVIEDSSVKLTAAKEKYSNEIGMLKAELQKEKDTGVMALEEAEKRHQDDKNSILASNKNQLVAASQTAGEKIAEAEKDRDEKIAEAQQQANERVINAEKDREDKVAAVKKEMEMLKTSTAREIDSIKETAAKEIKILQDHHAEKHKAKEEEVELVKRKASEEKAALMEDHDVKAKQLLAEKEATKLSLEEQHEKTLNQLKSEMETKERKAIDDLKSTELKMERRLKLMKQESETQLSGLADTHGKEKESLKDSISALEGDVQKMNAEIKIMERKYDDARKEIQNWEDLHNSRSYCNLTHIHEDSSAAVAVARSIANEKITVGTAYVAKVSEPHLKKGRELYDMHLKEHVDKHYSPVHEKHVVPFLVKAQKAIVEVTATIMEFLSYMHDKLVTGLGRSCPGFTTRLRKANVSASVVGFVERECQNPTDAVNKVLLLYLFLFVLLFWGFLWRTTKAIVYFPFKVLWYMTPLPFFFGKKRNEEDSSRPELATNGEAKSENGENGTSATFKLIKEEREAIGKQKPSSNGASE